MIGPLLLLATAAGLGVIAAKAKDKPKGPAITPTSATTALELQQLAAQEKNPGAKQALETAAKVADIGAKAAAQGDAATAEKAALELAKAGLKSAAKTVAVGSALAEFERAKNAGDKPAAQAAAAKVTAYGEQQAGDALAKRAEQITPPANPPKPSDAVRQQSAAAMDQAAATASAAAAEKLQAMADARRAADAQAAENAKRAAQELAKSEQGKQLLEAALQSKDPQKQELAAAKLEEQGETEAAQAVRAAADLRAQKTALAEAGAEAEVNPGAAPDRELALAVADTVRHGKRSEDRGLVTKAQRAWGLQPDGLYGPKTAAKVLSILGPALTPDPLYWPGNKKQAVQDWATLKASHK